MTVPASGAAFQGATARAQTFAASTAFTYRSGVLFDNPEFYWRLGDTAGSASLADASAHNRPGTNPVTDSGSAASRYQVAGAPVGDGDKAVQFDGAGSFVIRNHSENSPTADYSIELWFRTTSTTGGLLAASVDQVPNATSWSRMMYVDSGNRLTYGDWTAASGAQVQSVRSATTVNDGAWHHAVGVHSGTSLSLYLDGVSQGTVSSPQHAFGLKWALGGANVGWTGWYDVPASNYLNGAIDEFAYYKYGLASGDVTDHRNAINNGTGYANAVKNDNPTLYWRLNEPALSVTAADTTTNAFTGHYYLTDRIVGAQPGALASNNATWFAGRQTNAHQPVAYTNPNTFTLLVWFRTTTRRGGVLAGFAKESTGTPTGYDRHIYMLDDGRLAFGVFTGTADVAFSPAAYNDGQWHLAAASLGPAGARLYVDGVLVGQHASTTGENYTGYWRLGGSSLNGWPSPSASAYFTGWLDEFAVIGSQLSDARVAQLYAAR